MTTRYMVTPDHDDRVWFQDPSGYDDPNEFDPNMWSICWGSHDIHLVDGVFYNHYDDEPKKIAELANARFMTQDLVDRVTEGEDFHGFTGYKLFCAKAECAREKTSKRRYL